MIGLYQAKKVSPIFLSLLLCLSTLGLIIPYVHAQPVIAVDPVASVADPPDTFSINIAITGAEDLYAYEIKVGFDKTILKGETVEEGPFIRDNTESPDGTYFESRIFDTYVYAACLIIGPYPGIYGDGILFIVTLRVKAPGVSSLHIYDVILLDSTGTEITDFSTSDGEFRSTLPVAAFTFTPDTLSRPIVGENVTFDGSTSYDPDDTDVIISYIWDFNDTTTGTGAVVKHIFSEPSSPTEKYNVTLTVIDDEGTNSTTYQEIDVKLHDIAIVDIAGPDEILLHSIAQFNVTVSNKGSHTDSFNTTLYYNFRPIGTNSSIEMQPGTNQSLIFYWNTFINQTTMIPYANGTATWISPLNVTASDDFYALGSVDGAVQELTGYNATTTGWTGISRVEIGIEAMTETGGDDQIGVQVWTGKAWTPEYVRNITSTTDAFFWIDVTGTLSWEPSMVREGRIRARMKYIQVGGEATPIYVDWLPIRITPANPTDIPTGTYATWANALLIDQVSRDFRPGEESNPADNTLWGKPITVTIIPYHDVSVTIEQVSPTQVAVGRTSTVTAKIENLGNVDEIIDIMVYNNGTLVASQIGVTLRAGLYRRFSFAWFTATNTTVEGDYNVTVYVPPVVGDADTANNMHQTMVLMKLLPAPYFTFTPASPAIGEAVQFDASDSYVPGVPSGSITDYLWDFGDDTTGTGVTVTHAYAQPGSWPVKLTVIDDENLNNTITRIVLVPKLTSTITIAGSRTTVPLSLDTAISGAISPIRANVNVKINCTKIDENIWTTVANLTSNQQGQYSFVWVPDTVGQYQFKAFWPGDDTTLAAASSLLNVTVIRRDLAIVLLDLSRIWVTPGGSLQIDVTASNKGTAQESFNINVYYNDTLLEEKPVTDLVSSATKKVSFTWDTTNVAEGVYLIKATAGPLEGETYTADNSLTSGCAVQKAAVVSGAMDIFMYTTIALAVVIVAMAIYLFRMMRSKSKPS